MAALVSRLGKVARVQSWWSTKFSPVLGTFYATVCYVGGPAWPLVPRLVVLLAALAVGAVYVSVLNDWTDRADDLAGGKANYWVGRSRTLPLAILTGCLLIGVGMGVFFWHYSPVSSGLYLGSWVAFTAYSVAPVRLKKRGLAGVLVDASGSHLWPQLLTVSLASAWTGHALPGYWYGAVGTWALACGLRNILLHQLDDVVADEAAGVNTWVTRRGFRFVQRVGQVVVFPVEVLAFGALLALSQQRWPLVLLAVYLLLEGFKWRLWGARPVVLVPRARMLLHEYYDVFYPLGFLLVLVGQHPLDGWVLGLHLLLFAQRFWETACHLGLAGWLALRRVGVSFR